MLSENVINPSLPGALWSSQWLTKPREIIWCSQALANHRVELLHRYLCDSSTGIEAFIENFGADHF